MKRRQFQRSPAEFSADAARTPWLPHRMRRPPPLPGVGRIGKAVARWRLSRRSRINFSRCGPSAAPSGCRPVLHAVRRRWLVAEVHAIDGCDHMGLSPDGDLVETLCQGCLARLRRAMATYVGDKREMASRRGTRPVCTTCGRPTVYLHSVFAVRLIRTGAGIMTRLRNAALFVAVVAGDYAVLTLIDGQLVDFGVTAAICAGSSVAAGLIAYAGRRRRKAVARGRAAVWERRDQQAAADQRCPLCGGAGQKPSASPRFVDRQRARLCGKCAGTGRGCALGAKFSLNGMSEPRHRVT